MVSQTPVVCMYLQVIPETSEETEACLRQEVSKSKCTATGRKQKIEQIPYFKDR